MECPSLQEILSQMKTAELLGRGAQGSVYKIQDFVLKKMNLKSEKDILLFEGESSTLETLSKEESLKAYLPVLCWTEKTNEVGYILQRYEPSKTLQQLIQETPKESLPFDIGYSIYRNLRIALSRLMKAGFFHRDIKPENILIRTSSEEAMKIPIFIDFGLACSIPQCKYAIMAGTPSFMAPNILPRQVHKKQPSLTIQRNGTQRSVYVKTQLVPYHVSYITESYALALTLEDFLPIINFKDHFKEKIEMIRFIAEMKRNMEMNTVRRRRNELAKRMGLGRLNKYTIESVGLGTRKGGSTRKRRQSRKSKY